MWTYLLEPVEGLAGQRHYVVTRQPEDEDGGHAYEVTTDGRRWWCTCPAFKFKKRWLRDSCKHTEVVSELDGILKALARSS
jgi:hypothetical protein